VAAREEDRRVERHPVRIRHPGHSSSRATSPLFRLACQGFGRVTVEATGDGRGSIVAFHGWLTEFVVNDRVALHAR
jgi:hypothetical protein